MRTFFLFDGYDFKNILLEFDQMYEINNARQKAIMLDCIWFACLYNKIARASRPITYDYGLTLILHDYLPNGSELYKFKRLKRSKQRFVAFKRYVNRTDEFKKLRPK